VTEQPKAKRPAPLAGVLTVFYLLGCVAVLLVVASLAVSTYRQLVPVPQERIVCVYVVDPGQTFNEATANDECRVDR
jgi:uncharacterized membrane protein